MGGAGQVGSGVSGHDKGDIGSNCNGGCSGVGVGGGTSSINSGSEDCVTGDSGGEGGSSGIVHIKSDGNGSCSGGRNGAGVGMGECAMCASGKDVVFAAITSGVTAVATAASAPATFTHGEVFAPAAEVEQSHINNARNWMAAVYHEIKETVSLERCKYGERYEQWGSPLL